MNRFFNLALVALVLKANGVAGAQATATKPAAEATAVDAVGRVIDEAVRGHVFAGATVGVAVGGRISFIRGYGLADLEQRVPMTDSTVVRIGSVTKQFTAALVLRLVDQGTVSLDDPLAKFVPDFPRAAEVTVQQLLNHTSGIMSYTHPKVSGQLRDAARKDWTSKELIARIATLDPVYEFEPGTAWSYSNSGYMLLGAIIEKVSGKTYAEFLKSELLDPLEMTHTKVDELAEIVPGRARGYDPSKTASSGFRNADFISMGAAGPAGAMRSTASDLLKWHLALFGGKVLKPATLALMSSPGRLKDGRPSSKGRVPPNWVPETTEYGLGLFLGKLDGRATVGHGGAINGFNTWMETFPEERVTIVVLANTSYPAAEQTGPKVAQAWFKTKALP
jgi:D-alanyl-D-alanine carboxypeptidase